MGWGGSDPADCDETTDAVNSSLSQTYNYDLLDRLTSATGTSLSQGWTYDANGNRLTQTGSAASTYTVSSTSNRLSSVSGALSRSYSYDNSGNTTADGSATFTYNDAGRMVGATKASVTTAYALNALGQRVKKTTSGTSTYFVYDEAGHLIGEYNNSGNLIQETAWLGDIPVATLRPNGGGTSLFYVHTDHLNTPRRISRPSDNVIVWRWDGDPFGTTVANEDPDADSNLFVHGLRLAGQYFDPETGLHYNYFRDGYDPATGRYTQSDPVGLGGGLNTYAYVDSDPLSSVDPLGLMPGDIFSTREAAEADRAMVAALLEERAWALDVIVSRELGVDEWGVGYLTDVYQVDWSDETSCSNRFTYDWLPVNMGYPPGVGKKPGKLGTFKGRDALRRENNTARDAAKSAGLTKDQARTLHDEISGQNLGYQEILRRAKEIAEGK